MEKRPPVPKDLERLVLVEAGHRCAIPTCRQIPVEIAHIIPWAKCKDHQFENLIVLCPTCHTRFDRGEIDRQAMIIYKQKLMVLSGRYGDLEWRVLKFFAGDPKNDEFRLIKGLEILLLYLLEDGLLLDTGGTQLIDGITHIIFKLTPKGREFIAQWGVREQGN